MSRWTKARAERWANLRDRLAEHGLTDAEVDSLLKCERTLGNWSTRECGDGSNWAIEREELPDGSEGRPFNVYHGPGEPRRYPIADLERGALRRASAIAATHGLTVYHQGDPRGCSLYLLRAGDVPAGQCASGHYHKGIAVCID